MMMNSDINANLFHSKVQYSINPMLMSNKNGYEYAISSNSQNCFGLICGAICTINRSIAAIILSNKILLRKNPERLSIFSSISDILCKIN